MDFFIKKIFDGKADEHVHRQFSKFGRGEFRDRALVAAKQRKGKYSIGTSYEYANELVRYLAEKLGSEESGIKGAVVSTQDLTGELDFQDKKQFAGVKTYLIDTDMTGKDIVDLCEKFPKCFLGLSFSTADTSLKVKAKAPKSGKPSARGDKGPAADFCKIKTKDKELAKGLLFDVEIDNFSEALVNHTFNITDLEVPTDETDPKAMREKTKRKGKIIRETTVDGRSVKEEKDFEA